MSELLITGDPPPLPHLLPPIPTEPREVPVFEGQQQVGTRPEPWPLVNAVAQCARCGWLFVSREDPDGWGRHVYWTRLRWWHRAARRKLRAQEWVGFAERPTPPTRPSPTRRGP